MECEDCVGPHAHNLLVSKPTKHYQDTFDNVQRRFKETEPVVCPLTNAEMKMFVSMTVADLKSSGYSVSCHEENIQCQNTTVHYGIGREKCQLNVTEHVIDFEW